MPQNARTATDANRGGAAHAAKGRAARGRETGEFGLLGPFFFGPCRPSSAPSGTAFTALLFFLSSFFSTFLAAGVDTGRAVVGMGSEAGTLALSAKAGTARARTRAAVASFFSMARFSIAGLKVVSIPETAASSSGILPMRQRRATFRGGGDRPLHTEEDHGRAPCQLAYASPCCVRHCQARGRRIAGLRLSLSVSLKAQAVPTRTSCYHSPLQQRTARPSLRQGKDCAHGRKDCPLSPRRHPGPDASSLRGLARREFRLRGRGSDFGASIVRFRVSPPTRRR
jgi:hypothetical protein